MKTDLYQYKTEPFAHQIDAVTFASKCITSDPELNGFALFMSQGTGKTKTLIDIAENLFIAGVIDRVMIIAPNGVHRQWGVDDPKVGQIAQHGFVKHNVFIWQSNKRMAQKMLAWRNSHHPAELLYLCVNVEAFSVSSYIEDFKAFVKGGKTLVVIDEATSIKNPLSNRTNNIVNGLSDCVKVGKRLIRRTPCSVIRCILTGTPFAQGPYGVWSMMEFLKTNYFGENYYAFKAHYGIEHLVQYPGMLRQIRTPLKREDMNRIRKKFEEEHMSAEEIAIDEGMTVTDVQYLINHPECNTPYKNMTELKDRLKTNAFIITKEQCLDLPPKVYETVLVPMSTEQKRITKELQKQAYAMYLNHALDAKNKVGIRTRLHQVAGGFFPSKYELDERGFEVENANVKAVPIGKIEKLERLSSRLEDDGNFPVIVVTAFVAEAQYLYEQLRKTYRCGLIIGAVNKQERQRTEADFLVGNLDVLIATEQTIAKGYNFQVAHAMHFYSSTYSAEDRSQIEDRIHRIGQKDTCVYVDYLTEGSVDFPILETARGNLKYQDYMTSDNPEDFFKYIGRAE